MGDGDGYRADSTDLALVAAALRDGASALDDAAATDIRAVDAGVSSARIGRMLADVIRGMATAAHNMEGAADGVHATSGAYRDVENTNEGELRYKFGYGEGPGDQVPDDPPMILPAPEDRPRPVGGFAPEPTIPKPAQTEYHPSAAAPGGDLYDDE